MTIVSGDSIARFCEEVQENFDSAAKSQAEEVFDRLLELMDLEDICEFPDDAMETADEAGIVHDVIEPNITYTSDNEAIIFCGCGGADMREVCGDTSKVAYDAWKGAVLSALRDLINKKCRNYNGVV